MSCSPEKIHASRKQKPIFLVFMLLVFITHIAAFAKSKAELILDRTGVTGGIVVVLGCEDQELLVGLRVNDRYLIHGLDKSSSVVEKMREDLHSKNLYGPISVTTFDGVTVPYADNLVNLIVAQEPGNVPRAEIMRALAPYGVAVIANETIVKQWPKDLDEWTHNQHGPDNNPVARDGLVAPPQCLRWTSEPMWARHHDETPSTSAFVSSRGRLFYIIDETPIGFGSGPETWKLVARDAFNGMLLWKKDIPVGQWGNDTWSKIKKGGYYGRFEHPILDNRLVAVDDAVYVTLGYNAPVTVLGADTGEELHIYSDSPYVEEIAVDGHVLFISSYNEKQKPVDGTGTPVRLKKFVKSYDTRTSKLLWASKAYSGLNPKADHLSSIKHLFMTVGSKHVFVVDDKEVVALDRRSGKETWRSAMPVEKSVTFGFGFNSRGMCSLVASGETLLVLQLAPVGYKEKGAALKQNWNVPSAAVLRAYDADAGNVLWTRQVGAWGHHNMPEVFVIDGIAWIHDREKMRIDGLSLKTGEEKKVRDTTDAFTNGHHHRCYSNRATEKYLITSFRGLEYLPWDSDKTDHDHWVRSSCQLGMFPCNGLSYTLPHPCDCYITSKLNGVLALAGKQVNDRRPISERLETGPAYGKVLAPNSIADPRKSWPTYRHDPERSSFVSIEMPKSLEMSWTTDLKAKELTPTVVRDDLMVVAAKDTHTIYALDSSTGKERWRFTAGGPIDSPPTIYKGLAIVGSRDGRVYCVRASDGVLVWKFCAAPADRIICAFGKLESSWPVHGAVLVENDSAYIVAGRSSYLDGGFYRYRINAFTGEILEEGIEKSEEGVKVDAGRFPTVDYGLLSDVLVKSGEHVFMRQRSIFGAPYTGSLWGKGLASWAGFLDDSWFSRTGMFLDGIPFGSLIVFNEDTVFAVRPYKNVGAHPLFHPGQGRCLLTATERNPQLPKGLKYKEWISPKSPFPEKNRWQKNEPVRITSMALTNQYLYAAGVPDVIDDGPRPWETYRGGKEGIFMCVSAVTAETIFKTELRSAPVYDAMSVAQGSVFLSLKDGSVICFASNK